MENEKKSSATATCNIKREKGETNNQMSNVIYGMGFIGAAIYFIQHAATFWAGLFGVVKAIFWPAVIIYKVLELLKM